MSEKTVNVQFGSLFWLVGLVLVIMKLGGVQPVADWSWWLVTMPFWVGLVFALVVVVGMLLVGGSVTLLAAIFGGKKKSYRRW